MHSALSHVVHTQSVCSDEKNAVFFNTVVKDVLKNNPSATENIPGLCKNRAETSSRHPKGVVESGFENKSTL